MTAEKQNNICIELIIMANNAEVCAYASGSFYEYMWIIYKLLDTIATVFVPAILKLPS
jgi:hypothetical protein